MKYLLAIGFTAIAGAGLFGVQACSSDDSGTSSSSGGSETKTDSGTTGHYPTTPKDDAGATEYTCLPSGGTCECNTCELSGKTADDTKTCEQPSAGSQQGQCARVCCTGPGSTPDAGNGDAG